MMVPQKNQTAGEGKTNSPHRHPADNLVSPGPRARLRARLHTTSLDGELLAGADPATSPQLAARAVALTSTRSRAALADGLERWVAAAHGARPRSRVLPPRDLAAESEAEVHAIVEKLRGSRPVQARGIALLGALLSDATGPAYVGERDVLLGLLGEAHDAVTGPQ